MPEPKELKLEFSNEIDIEAIIAAPLVAASKANVVMATGQQQFLLDFCFEKKDDGSYEPRMIKMVMKKGVLIPGENRDDPVTLKIERLTFSVPLLCIVPFSSLAVDKVTVDFDMELTSAISEDYTNKTTEPEKITDKKCRLNGRISSGSEDAGESDTSISRNYRRKRSSTLKVSINAGPLPLSNGLLFMLDLYTKAIQPLPQPETDSETT
jgi:hypothetical protein